MHQAFYEQVAAERSLELMAEADHQRLVLAASPRTRHPLVGKGRMGAGLRLFRWGARLAQGPSAPRRSSG
jgi:hypothetical protein